MSDPNAEKTGDQKGDDTNKGKEITITATVDPKQMEELMGRLKTTEIEKKNLEEQLKTATDGKKELEEELENKKIEADDYKSKLSIMAKKKLEAKKTTMMEEAKKFIKDPERLKIIDDGMKTLEDVKATEFLIATIKETVEEGKRQHDTLQEFEKKKKELGAPDTIKTAEELQEWEKTKNLSKDADPTKKPSSGTLPFPQTQTGDGRKGYGSEAAMVEDLRRRSHSKDPEVAAEAKAILIELFRKWTVAVKKEYEGKGHGIHIEKGPEQASIQDITKDGGAAREKTEMRK